MRFARLKTARGRSPARSEDSPGLLSAPESGVGSKSRYELLARSSPNKPNRNWAVPEELVTVPLFSGIGGILGGIGGALRGGFLGTELSQTEYNGMITLLGMEGLVICAKTK